MFSATTTKQHMRVVVLCTVLSYTHTLPHAFKVYRSLVVKREKQRYAKRYAKSSFEMVSLPAIGSSVHVP